uniref:uncharacterized protein LOC105352368 n=1 Tax=Fragaria vesca subsp. vesca TaxID=101020 RepID=UPI0005C9F890|nr:PREDICTED: uncharacterized protein LOC105352368 [Fragaria vesca subsp. vesca]
MDKPTYRVVFSKNNISDDLNKKWNEVEHVFASHGLICTMDEDERKLILETANTEDGYITERARRALDALACGLNPNWVKPILLGQIYCDTIIIQKPEGMKEVEFSSKYDVFIDKFQKIYDLQNKWKHVFLLWLLRFKQQAQ